MSKRKTISETPKAPVHAPVSALVAAHIGAIAHHERLFNLNDWGLVAQTDVHKALGPIDEILIEICAARPSELSEIQLWQAYLSNVLPDATYDNMDLSKAVFAALLGQAGRS